MSRAKTRVPRIARALLSWYEANRRELPWRAAAAAGNVYAVWVSEVMLQQTRTETVIGRYDRFLRRFPDLATLAAAPLEAVLEEWSGLGYYRRARRLHAAAGEVVARGPGALPVDAAGWRALPGVGEYIAAALASITAGEAVPVVDGNVERVATRLLALELDPKSAAGRRAIRDVAARELMIAGRAGDSNQAMMELGALVCLPRRPRCERCPLAADCRALSAPGGPESFPRGRGRARPRRIRAVALVIERDDGRRLLFRRPEQEALLGGLWEAPWVEVEGRRGSGAPAIAAALGRRYGGRFEIGAPLGDVRHAITARDLRVRVHRGAWRDGAGDEPAAAVADGPAEAGWFDEAGIRRLPRSALLEKVLGLGGWRREGGLRAAG